TGTGSGTVTGTGSVTGTASVTGSVTGTGAEGARARDGARAGASASAGGRGGCTFCGASPTTARTTAGSHPQHPPHADDPSRLTASTTAHAASVRRRWPI